MQGIATSSLKVELRKRDATVAALEQLMASWQGGGRWGGGQTSGSGGHHHRGRSGDSHDGTDGARAPDQVHGAMTDDDGSRRMWLWVRGR